MPSFWIIPAVCVCVLKIWTALCGFAGVLRIVGTFYHSGNLLTSGGWLFLDWGSHAILLLRVPISISTISGALLSFSLFDARCGNVNKPRRLSNRLTLNEETWYAPASVLSCWRIGWCLNIMRQNSVGLSTSGLAFYSWLVRVTGKNRSRWIS